MSNRVLSISKHDDGTYTYSCFGSPIGYIQRVTLHKSGARRWRCVTVRGDIFYRGTLDGAKRAILSHSR